MKNIYDPNERDAWFQSEYARQLKEERRRRIEETLGAIGLIFCLAALYVFMKVW